PTAAARPIGRRVGVTRDATWWRDRPNINISCHPWTAGGKMIARIWHGYTTHEDAPSYESMLKPELLPGIGTKEGYRGSYLLRRDLGDEVEFITILLWDSLDHLRAAAGHDDYETAIVPEERRKFLRRYDAKSAHYDIAATHGAVLQALGA